MDELFDDSIYESESLEGWVIAKCDKWREHYNSNYETKFNLTDSYPTTANYIVGGYV